MVLGYRPLMSSHSAARLRAWCRARGFTLVELMVTIAIAAILMMIAVPSFQRLILNNRLNTAANALVDGINTARLDSIKMNTTTQFCGSTAATNGADALGAACGTAAGAVFFYQPVGAASVGKVQAVPPGLSSPVQIAAAGVTAVRFSGRGFGYSSSGSPDTPYTGTVAVICTSQLKTGNQRVITMTAGSILATASSAGACP